jgi:hypothetical protein
VTRDSAGVSIVEIPSAMDLPTWTIDTNPVVRVGDRPDDPAHELFRVRSAVQLADGRIVVGSQGSYDVRIFDSAGNHLRTFGRQGSGPGEFQWLGNLLVAGDTILAFDWQLQRATTFTTDGEVLGTTHVPFTRGGAVGRVGDGAFVATSFLGGMPRRPQGIHRDTAAIEVVHSSGARDTLGWGVAVEWFSHGDDGVPVVLPFGLRTYVAVANGQVNVAHNDRLEILRYSSGGTLAQVVRIDREPPRVTDAPTGHGRGRRTSPTTPRNRRRSSPNGGMACRVRNTSPWCAGLRRPPTVTLGCASSPPTRQGARGGSSPPTDSRWRKSRSRWDTGSCRSAAAASSRCD